jgi:hypothetical protein
VTAASTCTAGRDSPRSSRAVTSGTPPAEKP